MSDLYGNGIKLTERVLDFLWERQNLTANNIANVDTPKFKSQYMTFEEELRRNVSTESGADPGKTQKGVSQAIDSVHARFHTDKTESMRLDGNNVDMDQEQVQLAKTTLEYEYMVSSINNDLKRLQSAAKSF